MRLDLFPEFGPVMLALSAAVLVALSGMGVL